MSFADCIQSSTNCKPVIDVITIQHKTATTFTHIIKDSTDTAVDLTPYTAVAAPSTFTGARLIVKDLYHSGAPALSADLTITDAINGEVTITVVPDDFKSPGMYVSVIDLIIDDVTQKFFTYYFMVDPGLDITNCGPITITEIRLALRDTCPEANTLIDDYEFSNSEIAFCIRRPIDYWNGCLPPLDPISVTTFPYRYQWMNAAIGELLMIASRLYVRNNLTYTAGGVSVNDKDKGNPYQAAGRELIQEFMIFAQQTKVSQNMGNGFSSLGSDFGRNFGNW